MAPAVPPVAPPPYAIRLSIDHQDGPRDRVTSFFRIFYVIPIAIVLAAISGGSWFSDSSDQWSIVLGGGTGVLFLAPLLLIVFRQKYPRWWFDFSLQLMRFEARVGSYLLLLRDEYPSTDEEQSVHLDADYPDVQRDLDRWAPLYKWLLAIPHYVVLAFLWIGVIIVTIVGWFAILFTGKQPRGIFDYTVGVMRWTYRVIAYAFLLNTDKYPPFEMA
ncbi:MAG: DUF4389 domain-containing protein [Dehalococcoidia bacterium]|nr:DUF4389 domain-containing protein [Dehalococcoidia bacterium]